MKKCFFLAFIFLVALPNVKAATYTLKLDLAQAETRFLRKNLALLSAKYNIDIAKALEKQAKLWNNPTIYLEQNIYNEYTHKVFDTSPTGETLFNIQQLIQTAGKRNKRIQMQRFNTVMNEYQFYDLMRTLRLDLASNFYSLYFTQQKLKSLDKQIVPLRTLTTAYEDQLGKGNVSMREVSRLRSLLFNLETDRIGLQNDELGYRAALKTMLAVSGDTTLEPLYEESASNWLENTKLDELEEDARTHRADLLANDANVKMQYANYKLQKAMAVPDVTLGYNWDRAGNYIYNYHAVNLAFSLPVYDRNQNFIKIAKQQIDQSRLDYQSLAISLDNEVNSSYFKALELHKSSATFSKKALDNIEQLQKAIIENYQKHNITLIEFVDFYQSYTDNINAYLDLKLAREQALEELNYAVGRKLF